MSSRARLRRSRHLSRAFRTPWRLPFSSASWKEHDPAWGDEAQQQDEHRHRASLQRSQNGGHPIGRTKLAVAAALPWGSCQRISHAGPLFVKTVLGGVGVRSGGGIVQHCEGLECKRCSLPQVLLCSVASACRRAGEARQRHKAKVENCILGMRVECQESDARKGHQT